MDCKFRVIETWQIVSYFPNKSFWCTFRSIFVEFLDFFFIFRTEKPLQKRGIIFHSLTNTWRLWEILRKIFLPKTKCILVLPVLRYSIFSETRIVIFLIFFSLFALTEERHNFSQSRKHLKVVRNFTENIFAENGMYFGPPCAEIIQILVKQELWIFWIYTAQWCMKWIWQEKCISGSKFSF